MATKNYWQGPGLSDVVDRDAVYDAFNRKFGMNLGPTAANNPQKYKPTGLNATQADMNKLWADLETAHIKPTGLAQFADGTASGGQMTQRSGQMSQRSGSGSTRSLAELADIKATYEAGKNDPQSLAALAQQYGVTSGDLAAATGMSSSEAKSVYDSWSGTGTFTAPREGYYGLDAQGNQTFIPLTDEDKRAVRGGWWEGPAVTFENTAGGQRLTLPNGQKYYPSGYDANGNLQGLIDDPTSSTGMSAIKIDSAGNVLETVKDITQKGPSGWENWILPALAAGAGGLAASGAGALGGEALAGMDAGLAGIPEAVIGGGGVAAPIAAGTGAYGAEGLAGAAAGAGAGYGAEGLATGVAAGAGGSALGNILGGAGASALGGALASLIPAGIGAYGADQKSDNMKEIYDKYIGFGEPSRARYEATYKPGFTMADDPGYKDMLDLGSDSILRKLSVTGNPYGNPASLTQATDYVTRNLAYPALQDYRKLNASTGGLASFSNAAATSGIDVAKSQTNWLDPLGAGLADWLNPKKTITGFDAATGKFTYDV